MANFGDFRGVFDTIIGYLKKIERHNQCATCGGTPNTTTGGENTDIPAGLKSVGIVKTSATGDTVTIILSDGSIYPMTQQGEVFVDAASPGGILPDYTISGGAWKWHGIK